MNNNEIKKYINLFIKKELIDDIPFDIRIDLNFWNDLINKDPKYISLLDNYNISSTISFASMDYKDLNDVLKNHIEVIENMIKPDMVKYIPLNALFQEDVIEVLLQTMKNELTFPRLQEIDFNQHPNILITVISEKPEFMSEINEKYINGISPWIKAFNQTTKTALFLKNVPEKIMFDPLFYEKALADPYNFEYIQDNARNNKDILKYLVVNNVMSASIVLEHMLNDSDFILEIIKDVKIKKPNEFIDLLSEIEIKVFENKEFLEKLLEFTVVDDFKEDIELLMLIKSHLREKELTGCLDNNVKKENIKIKI